MAFCYYIIFLIDKGIGNNVLIIDTNYEYVGMRDTCANGSLDRG